MATRCPARAKTKSGRCGKFVKTVTRHFKGRNSRGMARRPRTFLVCKTHGAMHLDGTPVQG